MALSTMHEILILLEDEKEVPLYRINRWGRAARGVLAKLKNMRFVEKTKNIEEPSYKITEEGERYFDDTLDILRAQEKWDKRWRLVIFDVPESKRAVRDKLRRMLLGLGMGLLQASVWISPNDIKKQVTEIAKKLNLEKNIKYFEVTATTGLVPKICGD